MRVSWHPRPDLRGQVWEAQDGGGRTLCVRRLEEGLTGFGGTVNGIIVGSWQTPMQACEAVEKILAELPS